MIIIKVEKRHYEMDLESVLKKWQKYYETLFGKGNVVALPADHQIERIEIGDNLRDIKYSPLDLSDPYDDNEDESIDPADTSVGRRYKHRKGVEPKLNRQPTEEQLARRATLHKNLAEFKEDARKKTPNELNQNFMQQLRKDLMDDDNPMKDTLK
jgi:hypothetical protein